MSNLKINKQYSEQLDDELWSAVGANYDEDYDFSMLLEKINDPEFFRSFSERLLAFYNGVLNKDYSVEEVCSDLMRRGVSLSRNTVKNWFMGKTEPKLGDNDRKNMFALAFALELDIKQTEQLFCKVLLDKAFNKRNIDEFVYLYCIYNKKTLQEAISIIEQVKNLSNTTSNDYTMYSQSLADTIKQNMNENELIGFIASHMHNFALNNVAAKKIRNKLLDELTGRNNGNGLAKQEYICHGMKYSNDKYSLSFGGKDPSSIDFMLYVLFDMDFVQKDGNESLSIRNKFSRKEIYNQFPDKNSLSQENPSSYALRKDIILLYFYWYWVKDLLSKKDIGDYDGFVSELNDVLFECGFSPLYIGNPYDWLFLYCSVCENPLDAFREIMSPDIDSDLD